jgi:hypothetical protein
VFKHATNHTQTRWASFETEPTAQIAHLVFANTQANPKKNQKSYFLANARTENETEKVSLQT